jgi:hypothetical protein
MPYETYDRKHVALAQLETALKLYFEAQDFFSTITLAGAAEEILGKLLSAKGVNNSLDSIERTTVAIHQKLFGATLSPKEVVERANRARNCLKHYDLSSPTVSVDLKQEAKDMLQRAIDNYWRLEGELTLSMERFQREILTASPEVGR